MRMIEDDSATDVVLTRDLANADLAILRGDGRHRKRFTHAPGSRESPSFLKYEFSPAIVPSDHVVVRLRSD